jgi:hypothetical protein
VFSVCGKIWHKINRYIEDWGLVPESFGTLSIEKKRSILLGLLKEKERVLKTFDQKIEALDWYLKSPMT